MNRILPNRPGRLLALLGFFVAATVLGWSGEKRVWVQYAPGAKGQVMAALAKANGRVHYEFDSIESVAVSMPEQALFGISHNPHVLLVEEDPIRVMSSQTVPYGIEMVQAFDAISNGGAGQGIVVGVIDSGVYRDHADLPYAKLSGYPDFGGSDERTWYRDILSHGTHVVGTIAAVNDTAGVVGVAPGVGSVFMVKVFGDTGNWIYSSSLVASVQYAVNTGHAKIISMSLGGPTKSKTEENGLKSLYNSGVLLVAAAGNDGNTATSYPAGYAAVMSVAAIDANKVIADFSQKNSTVEISGPGVGVLSTTSYNDVTTLSVAGASYSNHHVEFSGRTAGVTGELVYGGLGNSTNVAWSGKVVLVDRGTISFYDKVHNVELSGGVACIIANNVAGDLSATLGAGFSSTIPAVSVTQADGTALKALTGASATVASSFAQPASGYDYFDGTSMATPHVSGVAALIWSKYPQATNAQVRQAMTSTAKDLGAPGRDNSYGYGLVQAAAALGVLDALFGNPPPPPPPVALAITNSSVTPGKGKPGPFTVSFTTNKSATGTITTSPNVGSLAPTSGTSFSKTFQGTRGTTYTITVSATAGLESDSRVLTITP